MSSHVFDRQKWARMSIFEQMGNVGSEVGRALAAKRRGDAAGMTAAFQRGLDLLDATADAWAAQKSPRTAEILRAREQFAQAVQGAEDLSLENYFMEYAIAARLHR